MVDGGTAGGIGVMEAIAFGLALFAALLLVMISRSRAAERRAARALVELRAERDDQVRIERDAAQVRDDEVTRLRAGFQAMPWAVWTRGPDQALRPLNGRSEAIREDLEKASTLAVRALTGNRPAMESRTVVVEGRRRLLEITETPDGTGGTTGTAVDLTGLEDLQAQVSRQIEAQQELLGALDTAVAIFGPDHRLVMANAAFAELWRVPPDRLDGDPTFAELLEIARERRRLPEQADFRAWRDDLIRLFRTLVEPYEDLMFLPDESTIRMRVQPYAFGGLLMTFQDVTDQLSLQRSINTLSEVQRESLDSLNEGIVVFGGDGRLRLSNPSFRTMWGFGDSPLAEGREGPHVVEILGRMHEQYPAGVDWEREFDVWTAFLEDRHTHSGRVEQASGRILDYNILPLPDGATLINFHGVTDTLAVQRALQEQAEALEMADRLKSEFMANVSYELRTPLNAIIGFSEILANEYAGPINDRQKEYSQAIIESSNQLVRLVNDILDLASIEAGYLELERAPVDFQRLRTSIETLIRERARNRGVEFRIEMPDEMPVVLADERRLTQALFNLVSNGVSFSGTAGEVLLKMNVDGGALRFSVFDTGVGYNTSAVTAPTARFERGGRQARTEVSLSLVRSLIELHGGRVEVNSKPGEGTEVSGWVPLLASEAVLGGGRESPSRARAAGPGAGFAV